VEIMMQSEELYDAIIAESEDIGYYTLPESDYIGEIKSFCKEYDFEKRGIKNIAILGIGGSSLGIRAIDTLLRDGENRDDKKLVYFENVDPFEIKRNLKDLKLQETFFIVTSKSGSTVETISHLKYLLSHFDITVESSEFREHFVTITDSGSLLDSFSQDHEVKSFHIPHNVGGRFSIFSAVGLLPFYILGYDVDKLLLGAYELKESFFNKNEDEMCEKALMIAGSHSQRPINVLFSYSSAFKYFNDWYVQLWGESLGKIDFDGNRVGLTPIGLIGSIDQHSFLQLIIEGPRDKSVTMIKVKDMQNDLAIPDIKIPYLEKTDFINGHTFNTLINAQCDATMQSIKDQDIPVDLIEIETIDEKSVGYLIFYYELLTSMVGKLLNVNTYDQPGVELGKRILAKKF
jgi:glucose-6-phosphate isomerase